MPITDMTLRAALVGTSAGTLCKGQVSDVAAAADRAGDGLGRWPIANERPGLAAIAVMASSPRGRR